MPAWTGWPYASTARPNGGDACAALLQRRRNSPNLINLTTQIFADISLNLVRGDVSPQQLKKHKGRRHLRHPRLSGQDTASGFDAHASFREPLCTHG